jgi:hypothetical protein
MANDWLQKTFDEMGYGLDRRTVLRVLAMKSIPTIKIPMGETNQLLIDLQQVHEPPTVPGKVLSLKNAAAAIGIGADALSKLRASGHFEVRYFARYNGYHERDIKQFRERLLTLNCNPTNNTLPRNCVTLQQVTSQNYGICQGGASIIPALLPGELRVLGNIDGIIPGLFFSRAEFQQFGKNHRARQNGNARTPLEVANEIHCVKACVRGLVLRRLLDGWNTPTGLRISERSIARFKKKYVSLASIAREIGSSTGVLMRYCAAKHISMVLVKYRHEETKQSFVRVKDRNELLSFQTVGC